MTPEQLDEIEKVAKAATPGPWARTHSAEVADLWAGGGAAPILRAWSDRNIDFIAAMREHALPLVKALREAWSEADITKAFHDVAVKERDYERVRANRLERERDEARAEIERLRSVLRQVHALAEAAVRGTAVGAWLQTQEIHKITKGMVE